MGKNVPTFGVNCYRLSVGYSKAFRNMETPDPWGIPPAVRPHGHSGVSLWVGEPNENVQELTSLWERHMPAFPIIFPLGKQKTQDAEGGGANPSVPSLAARGNKAHQLP